MRRSSKVLVIAVVAILAASTVGLYMKYASTRTSLQGALQTQQETQDQYAQAVGAIAEIQDSLATILPEGEKLPGKGSAYSTERGMGGPNNREILERIASLRAGLERGKARVEKLEASLESSGRRVSGLKKLVATLRRNITEKEQQLTEREQQLTAMAVELDGVRDTLRTHDETLAARQRQLATVYFVAAPKHDLLATGIIAARGGLLGIGRTLEPTGAAPPELFSVLDTDTQDVLQLDSPKAEVVSAQPPSSYELRLVDGRMQLHILDPQQFRRVRQLVIVTA